ncbi:MAG: DUF7022 family protein [Bacilli bacterium]
MAKKSTSKNQKDRYEVYKKDQTWKANRKLKLERHLVKHPEDTIAQAALKALSAANAPRRSTPIGKESMTNSGRVYAMIKAVERALIRVQNSTFGKGNPKPVVVVAE